MEIDLESVDHVLRTTRSVRRRIDFERPVEREVLEECIELAVQAPTGAGAESWRFTAALRDGKSIAGWSTRIVRFPLAATTP